jgi:hypothetical protein
MNRKGEEIAQEGRAALQGFHRATRTEIWHLKATMMTTDKDRVAISFLYIHSTLPFG